MTRQRTDEERKREIREAAIRCFVRRGYAGTRLIDIAREAGLSKGGVYFHYRTKEELFQEILDGQLEALQRRWSFSPVDDEPVQRLLERLVIAHLRTMEDDPWETRFCNLLISMAPQEPSYRARLAEVVQAVRGLYTQVIRRGVDDGSFVQDDPEQLARSTLAFIYGLASQSALDPEGRLPLSPEEGARRVIDMVRAPTDPYVGAENRIPSSPIEPAVSPGAGSSA